MPRAARIVLPGLPHHVLQCGNNRQAIFFADDDRRAYLDLLAQESERSGLALLAYALMTNHVHLIVVPGDDEALARAVGRTHWRYTQYLNRLRRRSGHLWQNRFYSCPLDGPHLRQACAYVERNPVRARLVRLAWRYPWSSAAVHVGEAPPPPWLDVKAWRAWCTTRAWRSELQRPEDEDELRSFRAAIHRGRPLVGDRLLSKLERQLGRCLRPRPVGRPKGAKTRKPAKKPARPGSPVRK